MCGGVGAEEVPVWLAASQLQGARALGKGVSKVGRRGAGGARISAGVGIPVHPVVILGLSSVVIFGVSVCFYGV